MHSEATPVFKDHAWNCVTPILNVLEHHPRIPKCSYKAGEAGAKEASPSLAVDGKNWLAPAPDGIQ
jgi:glucose-6-phosphate 1-dehydrogenase